MKKISCISLSIFIFVHVVGVCTLQAQSVNSVSDKRTYKYSKLRFSIQHPANLTPREFPEGLSVQDESRSFYDGIDILVVNTSLEKYEDYFDWVAVHFWRLRKAKSGEIFIDNRFPNHPITKVENLFVKGYPAVKVISESKRAQNVSAADNECKPAPPFYVVGIYFRKGKTIWKIESIASDKAQQDRNAPIFDEIVKSIKFYSKAKKLQKKFRA